MVCRRLSGFPASIRYKRTNIGLEQMWKVRVSVVCLTTTAVLSVAGCAATQPSITAQQLIIDTKGVDSFALSRDRAECQRYANGIESGSSAIGGALAGGLLGAALGATVGDGGFARDMAGVGAISGGAAGYGSAQMTKSQVLRNCMRGRGYAVLN